MTIYDAIREKRSEQSAQGRALVPYQPAPCPAVQSGRSAERLGSFVGLVFAALLLGAMLTASSRWPPRSGIAPGPIEDGMSPVAMEDRSPGEIMEAMRRLLASTHPTRMNASEGVRKSYPPSRAALVSLARSIAEEEDVDPALFESLIGAESNWRIDAVSSKCAMSLAQLMPATARELGLEPKDYFDGEANLRGGARYLRALLDETGDPALALAAYNAGLGRVRDLPPSRWPAETRRYVAKVLNHAGAPPRIVDDKPAGLLISSASGAIVSMRASSASDAAAADAQSAGAGALSAAYWRQQKGNTQ